MQHFDLEEGFLPASIMPEPMVLFALKYVQSYYSLTNYSAYVVHSIIQSFKQQPG